MNSGEINARFNLLNRIAAFFRVRLAHIRGQQQHILRAALEKRDAAEMEKIRQELNKQE